MSGAVCTLCGTSLLVKEFRIPQGSGTLCSYCAHTAPALVMGVRSSHDSAPPRAVTAAKSGFTPGDLVTLPNGTWGVVLATCGVRALVWRPTGLLIDTVVRPLDIQRGGLHADLVEVLSVDELCPAVLPGADAQRSE